MGWWEVWEFGSNPLEEHGMLRVGRIGYFLYGN
jgi:hypothetical protein